MEDVVSERSWVRNPLMPSTPTRSLAAFSSDQAPGDVTLCPIRVSATRAVRQFR